MGALTRTILMRRVGTSELDLVAKIGESFANLVTLAEFTTTIHAYIFLGTNRGIVSKPTVKPIDRRSFGSKCASENTATVVVSDEDVTGFRTIEAHKIIETFWVTAPLNHKCKINRETLKADSGNHDGGGTAGGLAEFSGKANGAIVDRFGHRQQGRQVTTMSMQLRQTAEVDVPKMLTPEHCESRSAKTADKEITKHGRKLGVTVQRMKQRDSNNRRWIQQ
jgi:hypothetical protein